MTRKKSDGLTEQQVRFCEYYIELGVGVAAAIKANYSEKSARTKASKLLSEPAIRAYIDKRMKSKNKEIVASQDEVLSFLTNVMRGKVIEEVPLSVGEGFQDLIPLEVTPIGHRVKAADMLGKRYALWKETPNVEGDIEIKVTIDYGNEE